VDGTSATEPSIAPSILARIGNTPIVELRRIVPDGHARILMKLESQNPTGSMKDRAALAMIEAAERDGRLPPDGSVVEYTGGSAGVSLAFICGAKGYPIRLVTSDAFSREKRRHMEVLGAELTLVPSDYGGMDEALTRTMIETARGIREETGAYWTDQLNNRDQLSGYEALGAEIWRQTGGAVDAFVQGVGTAASLIGTTTALRREKPDLHVVAVEPSESPVLSGGEQGAHRIEGIGAGFVVPLWEPGGVEEIATVPAAEAMEMARRLAREEVLFAGTSTGANLVAALKVAKWLGPDATVVTLMVDSGMKYFSTELYGEV